MSTTGRLTHHPGHRIATGVPETTAPPEPPAWLVRAAQPRPDVSPDVPPAVPLVSPGSSLPQVSLNLLASLMSENVLTMRRIEGILDQLARALLRLPERKPVAHPLRYDPDTWPRQP